MTDHNKLKALALECIERDCEWEYVTPNFGSTSGDRLMREYINEVVPANVLALIAENEALRTQVAELSKDAERYRWLRELPNADSMNVTYMGSDLDMVIDAAIDAQKGKV